MTRNSAIGASSRESGRSRSCTWPFMPVAAIGSMLMAPTDWTPGSARSRSSNCSTNRRERSPSASSVAPGSATPKVSTPLETMPRSCRVICCRLFTVSPATATSMTASATSLVTSTRVIDRARPAVAPRVEPSRSASLGCARATCNAGSVPAMKPQSVATPAEKVSTAGSSPIAARRGKLAGAIVAKSRSSAAARPSPRAPPPSERRSVSVISCRSNRPRPAPSAVRTAISRCLVMARASRRLATFAHAISSTTAVVPSSTHNACRGPRVATSCSASALNPY